ncbi:hypothetical protein ITI46_09995 [Streptomyces oryzae]|uniref:WYL domain-containing protein n=1 Tax=Streptomyces oryzae TaxID=1434886 RepID=A0ABS3X9H3_9ACTN|nr:hypothetical protein [Streptomyces oryzae]MBO8192001.1 hypothetical protein [Streptomyces oryzae]
MLDRRTELRREQSPAPGAVGWIEVRLTVQLQPDAISDLLSLGAEAEVRDRTHNGTMLEAVQALAACYPAAS